jgi:adenine-specific DNA-methyltransferase
MSNYNQLKDALNDIFELNKADLDFGIYRIMNQKRKQVNEFIEKQLPEDIKQALSETQSTDKTEIENELKTLKKNLDDAGIVAEESPKYNTLKERLQSVQNTDVLEQEVFSHLANFFKRYYKDGDFISMRRYKKDVYAIPYEGEEVKLHWANHDQYYIKSSENFKNYSFKTPDGKTVNFQLKEVSTEQNNNKTQGDAERRFAIFKELPVEEIDGVLNINFVYEPFSKATKQESLLSEALELLTENVPSTFTSVFTLSPTEKNSKRTLLEKHLNDFVSKNSFDYFIHKDLGGFLSRELDFYIKNEVLYLDDINTKQGDFFLAQLSKVKAIKTVASKIITFLAQIENFQKKLWLKKKFVVRTDYCITLDKIPSNYYPEIIQNKEQIAEWKSLFDVEIQNVEQLVFEQFLVLDTKFFDEGFKDRLLAEFDNLDTITNGILVNSDNFQALNIFQEKFNQSIDTIYIDPPYNTNASEIVYKNGYKNSSWLELISDRLNLSKLLQTETGIINVAIDDFELSKLSELLNDIYGFENKLGNYVIVHNPGGRHDDKFIATAHEYNLVYGIDSNKCKTNLLPLDEEDIESFKFSDEFGKYRTREFRRSGNNSTREARPYMYYPIFFNKEENKIEFLSEDDFKNLYSKETNKFNDELIDKISIDYKEKGYDTILPIDPNKIKRVWRWSMSSLKERIKDVIVEYKKHGILVKVKDRLENKEGLKPKSVWYKPQYTAALGTKTLADLFKENLFSYPKSVDTVKDVLRISDTNNYILDYFSGSGTTAHATIKLNREDGGNRKYILVEMGTYFNTVTKPRIQKVIYSDNWKNGKPQDKAGISQIVKYQVLESYEDTLNNLYLENKTELDFTGKAKEEYVLQYMLELESREHLFNLQMFRKPFNYQLKVTENNELKPTKVDLVETFNYLIGLYVSKVQRVKDIKVVEGTTRTGIKTLVIWRDLDTTTHDEVEKLLRRFYDSQRTKEFQQIYINGDHHLENLRSEGDSFKIKLIEETFFKKMFNETEL